MNLFQKQLLIGGKTLFERAKYPVKGPLDCSRYQGDPAPHRVSAEEFERTMKEIQHKKMEGRNE